MSQKTNPFVLTAARTCVSEHTSLACTDLQVVLTRGIMALSSRRKVHRYAGHLPSRLYSLVTPDPGSWLLLQSRQSMRHLPHLVGTMSHRSEQEGSNAQDFFGILKCDAMESGIKCLLQFWRNTVLSAPNEDTGTSVNTCQATRSHIPGHSNT
jgi:hypothetical protein